MAQEAASELSTRDQDVHAVGDVARTNHSRHEIMSPSSFIEASKVSAMFGKKLGRQMNVYTGDLNDFGCPGNIVDHWRVQFTGREAGSKSAKR